MIQLLKRIADNGSITAGTRNLFPGTFNFEKNIVCFLINTTGSIKKKNKRKYEMKESFQRLNPSDLAPAVWIPFVVGFQNALKWCFHNIFHTGLPLTFLFLLKDWLSMETSCWFTLQSKKKNLDGNGESVSARRWKTVKDKKKNTHTQRLRYAVL